MTFLKAIAGIAFSPPGIVSLLLVGAIWVLATFKVQKLNKVLVVLRALPVSQRLYTLEREFKMHPKKGGKPISHVRRLRRLWLRIAVGVSCIVAVLYLGTVFYQMAVAKEAALTFRDLGIAPTGQRYLWKSALVNTGSKLVIIDQLKLKVIHLARHPENSHPPPADAGAGGTSPIIRLSPAITVIPIVGMGQETALSPGERRNITFQLEARHKPREGWIYDVRLEADWHPARTAVARHAASKIYRLGWPGMLHWSQSTLEQRRAVKDVVDPVSVVE